MSFIKLIVAIATFFISGYVQFFAASLSLPIVFAQSGTESIILVIAMFGSANLLIAGAISLIYTRYDFDSRISADLYAIGSLPLLASGANVIGIGVLGIIIALLLYINYYALLRQQ